MEPNEITFEVPASPRTESVFTFDEHMWNKLHFVKQHQK